MVTRFILTTRYCSSQQLLAAAAEGHHSVVNELGVIMAFILAIGGLEVDADGASLDLHEPSWLGVGLAINRGLPALLIVDPLPAFTHEDLAVDDLLEPPEG